VLKTFSFLKLLFIPPRRIQRFQGARHRMKARLPSAAAPPARTHASMLPMPPMVFKFGGIMPEDAEA